MSTTLPCRYTEKTGFAKATNSALLVLLTMEQSDESFEQSERFCFFFPLCARFFSLHKIFFRAVKKKQNIVAEKKIAARKFVELLYQENMKSFLRE